VRDRAYNFEMTDFMEKNHILVHRFLASEGVTEVHKNSFTFKNVSKEGAKIKNIAIPVFVFREHQGGTYVRILTFVFLLTSAPPVQAQMLYNPVFQLQEQGLSNGYFN